MSHRIWRVLTFVCVAVPLLPGQQGNVGGPTSGFVFDSAAHALRPILGIPGASSLGDPVGFTFDVASVAVAPNQDSAFVTAAEGGMHLFRLSSGTWSERSVDGLGGSPDRVWFSPSGSAAALYAAGKAQIVTGLPDSPVLARTQDLGGTPAALAISDDGAYLLLNVNASIRLLGSGGDTRNLADASVGALVAFAAKGHDGAVSDPLGAGLVLYRDLAGSAQQSVVAAPDDSTASPAGLAFSGDGRKLFLASSTARSVSMFDLQTGDRAAIACNCVPAGLVSMGSLFRLNELGTAPLWLFDAGAAEPRIVFVPTLAAPAAN
ncbi:MAG TPA: hypothetical protein VGH38_36300 [Bryobacteraceae bacterium]